MSISIKGLVAKYKRHTSPALFINSLNISEGIVAVVGENGAGKSTLFKCLQGFLVPESGTIVKRGKSDKFSSVQVFQSEQAFEYVSVREWIEFQALLRGQSLSKSDVVECVKKAQLVGREKHLVSKLSGGQQRKLNLICASFGNPDLLILDEPTTGLDQEARKEYWNTVNEYYNRHHGTLLFSSHYMDEVEENAQQVILLKRGEVLTVGSPKELIDALGLDYIAIVPKNKIEIFSKETQIFSSEGEFYIVCVNNAKAFISQYGSIEQLVENGIQIRKPNMSDVYTLNYKKGKNNA